MPNRISVVGGTGALGGALALRYARAGLAVTIGSRDAVRAAAAAAKIAADAGCGQVTGLDNRAAAAAGDIVFVTVPFSSQEETLKAVRDACRGKIVVDTTVPLVPPKVARVQLPAQGSAAQIAAELLGPDVRVVSGLHNISATKLGMPGDPGCDVLVFGDDVDARGAIVDSLGGIGLRAFHAGPLANSAAAEAMTSVLISINKRHQVKDGAGIRITGPDLE
ncbi:MAG: NADPH-dependent F420 reductase [Rhizobiaceae bacterium]